MKNSWKINVLAWGCALGLVSSAAAADRLLAKTELELEQGRATAELWGDELSNGYAQNLLVLLKDAKGKLITAYAPSIKGGYSAVLEAVQVKPLGTEQELAAALAARQRAQEQLEKAEDKNADGKGTKPAKANAIGEASTVNEAKGTQLKAAKAEAAKSGEPKDAAANKVEDKQEAAKENSPDSAAKKPEELPPLPYAVKTKEGRYAQQLLLGVAQGDWRAPSEYRVLDFTDSKRVVELFDASEGRGLVSAAACKEKQLEVQLSGGQRNVAQLPEGVEAGRLTYGGLFSLTPHDVNGDGQQELLGSQQLLSANHSVADVGAVWQLKQELKWQHSAVTIMTNAPIPKGNTINMGMDVGVGRILPRKMVVPGGEATYPVFVSREAELQNKVNEALAKENAAYLGEFYKGTADMAFKVIAADARLISLQLISGKKQFVHHYVNIAPQSGKVVKLEQVLNYKDKRLLPKLRELCQNKQMLLEGQPPAEWYLQGEKLYLTQNICGKNEVASFALVDLQDFVLDKKLLKSHKN